MHTSVEPAHPDDASVIRQGILYMILGTMLVPVMDVAAKLLGQTMSPLLIGFGRFFFQILLTGGFLVMFHGVAALWSRHPFVHMVRGVLLASATVLFFWALVYLPLAEAISIFFVQPMILTLLSALFLGETIGWHRRLAVLAGFAGALLIIRPGTTTFTAASLLPLGAAVFCAGYMTLTRAIAKSDSAATMQFVSALGATALLALALLIASVGPTTRFTPGWPTAVEWAWLALIGMIASGGHLLVTMGMKRAPASTLAPFGYVEIVAATLLGWWVFGDWPDTLSWCGVSVIIASGFYVFHRERRLTVSK